MGYQAGRVVGYAFAGSLAGRFGVVLADAVPLAGQYRLLAVMTGLAFVVLALRVHGLAWWPRPGARAQGSTVQLRRSPNAPNTVVSRGLAFRQLLPRSATVLGAMSVMLPCGALASALLLAASTADAVAATVVMASFAVATSPALWASTGLERVISRIRAGRARALITVALLAVATFVIIPHPRPSEAESADPAATVPTCH